MCNYDQRMGKLWMCVAFLCALYPWRRLLVFFSFKWVRGCALKQKKSQSGLSHVHGPKIRGLLVALSPAHQRLGGTSKIPPKQYIRLATILLYTSFARVKRRLATTMRGFISLARHSTQILLLLSVCCSALPSNPEGGREEGNDVTPIQYCVFVSSQFASLVCVASFCRIMYRFGGNYTKLETMAFLQQLILSCVDMLS